MYLEVKNQIDKNDLLFIQASNGLRTNSLQDEG